MATTTKTDSGPADNPTTEDLAKQVEVLRGDVRLLTETLGEIGRGAGRDAKARIEKGAEDLRMRAELAATDARARADTAIDDAERYVRRNPMTALGIAALVGLLFGLFSGRR